MDGFYILGAIYQFSPIQTGKIYITITIKAFAGARRPLIVRY